MGRRQATFMQGPYKKGPNNYISWLPQAEWETKIASLNLFQQDNVSARKSLISAKEIYGAGFERPSSVFTPITYELLEVFAVSILLLFTLLLLLLFKPYIM